MIQTDWVISRAEEMFMRYGIKSVTMDDIARELGISKKTLYQHVDNKTDLIDRIIEQYINKEKKCMQEFSGKAKDSIDALLMIARHVIMILRRMKPTTIFDMKKYYHASWEKMDKFQLVHVYNVIKSNMKRGIEEGLYRDDLNADVIAKLYVGKAMLLTDEEMFPARLYNRDDLFMEHINYHLRGILSDKGMKKLKSYQPIL